MNRLKVQVWSRERQDHQRAYREHAFKLDEMVPERGVVDKLLDLYLSTFETTYRILHIPTFLQQYEDYWMGPQNADMAFLAKLLALMAISSSFYTPATKLNRTEYLIKLRHGGLWPFSLGLPLCLWDLTSISIYSRFSVF